MRGLASTVGCSVAPKRYVHPEPVGVALGKGSLQCNYGKDLETILE